MKPAAILAAVRIPRWRGFNLTELVGRAPRRRFRESDFRWTAEWGFDFVRLPLSYLNWSDAANWFSIREKALAPIDEALKFGERYGIHVSLSLHHIPGYRVNGPEPAHSWLFGSDEAARVRALEAAAHHWRFFAVRYRGIPNARLSFDLINEPPFMADPAPYEQAVRTLIGAVRQADPERLIFVEGVDLGQTPALGLMDAGVAHSTRGYLPKALSHYGADWTPHQEFETLAPPRWPLTDRQGAIWDRERLRHELILKWKPLMERGIGVHVGEWGAYCHTPHKVALAWMKDVLSLWKEAGWGWALWHLRGAFGVVDSRRADVRYERFHWHRLDRDMLEILRAG